MEVGDDGGEGEGVEEGYAGFSGRGRGREVGMGEGETAVGLREGSVKGGKGGEDGRCRG